MILADVMARPLRIQYPGAVYHVMNRGSSRQKVFLERRDYELFSIRLVNFTIVGEWKYLPIA